MNADKRVEKAEVVTERVWKGIIAVIKTPQTESGY
jgi:hypothetical protein